MDSFSNMIAEGGPSMMVILAIQSLGVLWVGLLGVVALMRLRIPAILWWGPALMAVVIGAFGTWWGQGYMLEALLDAPSDAKGSMALMGHSQAILPRATAHFGAAVLLLLTVPAAGLAAGLRPGTSARWSVGPAVGATFLVGTAGFLSLIISLVYGVGSKGLLISLLFLLLGSAGAGLSALRTGMEPRDEARLAELRIVVALSLIGAAVLGGQALAEFGTYAQFSGAALAAPESRAALAAMGQAAASGGTWITGLAFLLCGLSGIAIVSPSSRNLVDGRTMGSVVFTIGGLVIWMVLLFLSSSTRLDYQPYIDAALGGGSAG